MTKVEVVRKAMMDALKAGDKPRKRYNPATGAFE